MVDTDTVICPHCAAHMSRKYEWKVTVTDPVNGQQIGLHAWCVTAYLRHRTALRDKLIHSSGNVV